MIGAKYQRVVKSTSSQEKVNCLLKIFQEAHRRDHETQGQTIDHPTHIENVDQSDQ